MSENENQSSKVIFKGKDLSLEPSGVNYNTKKSLPLNKALAKSVGSKSYPNLKSALKDVEKVLKAL